jgi:hypothetical protein
MGKNQIWHLFKIQTFLVINLQIIIVFDNFPIKTNLTDFKGDKHSTMFSRSIYLVGLGTLYDQTGSEKSNMAAAKLEVGNTLTHITARTIDSKAISMVKLCIRSPAIH